MCVRCCYLNHNLPPICIKFSSLFFVLFMCINFSLLNSFFNCTKCIGNYWNFNVLLCVFVSVYFLSVCDRENKKANLFVFYAVEQWLAEFGFEILNFFLIFFNLNVDVVAVAVAVAVEKKGKLVNVQFLFIKVLLFLFAFFMVIIMKIKFSFLMFTMLLLCLFFSRSLLMENINWHH